MNKLTRIQAAARGEMCTIRIPGICNHDPATTVLCHVRRKWNCGVALKPADTHAFFGCSACHAVHDGQRISNFSRQDLTNMALDAVLRTHDRLAEKGLIEVKQ